jgi:hypothetical protein
MRISNDGTFDSEPWEAFAASKPWTITAGDALKTVYIKFRDVAGNESGAFTDTITLETVLPTGTVTIDAGATYTTSTSVTLDLTCDDGVGSGCDQMRISNDGTFDSEPWEAFAVSKAWTLTAGDATKTVYVIFRDVAGNESSPVDTDDIILDTTDPVVASASASTDDTHVDVVFTEDNGLDPGTAGDFNNYAIWDGGYKRRSRKHAWLGLCRLHRVYPYGRKRAQRRNYKCDNQLYQGVHAQLDGTL